MTPSVFYHLKVWLLTRDHAHMQGQRQHIGPCGKGGVGGEWRQMNEYCCWFWILGGGGTLVLNDVT